MLIGVQHLLSDIRCFDCAIRFGVEILLLRFWPFDLDKMVQLLDWSVSGNCSELFLLRYLYNGQDRHIYCAFTIQRREAKTSYWTKHIAVRNLFKFERKLKQKWTIQKVVLFRKLLKTNRRLSNIIHILIFIYYIYKRAKHVNNNTYCIFVDSRMSSNGASLYDTVMIGSLIHKSTFYHTIFRPQRKKNSLISMSNQNSTEILSEIFRTTD